MKRGAVVSPSLVAPDPVELVDVDEIVSISMHGTVVVVRPRKQPDALGTQVLADVVNSATLAGSTVVLHRPDVLVAAHAGVEATAGPMDDADVPVPVRPAGVGFLELRSEGGVWTIDVGAAGLVRSDRPVDRLFVAMSDWTPFDAVWIGPRFVSALTTDGSLVAGRRVPQRPCGQRIGDGRQEVRTLRHTA